MTIFNRLLKRFDLKRDYQETFSTPHGKRVLDDIMKVSGVTKSSFTTDGNELLVVEGQRRLALSIYKQVHSSMDPLINAMKEEQNNTE